MKDSLKVGMFLVLGLSIELKETKDIIFNEERRKELRNQSDSAALCVIKLKQNEKKIEVQ